MKNLIILLVIATGIYQFWYKSSDSSQHPKFEGEYISVYGRNTCSFTKQMLADLDSSGITYHYFNVDDKAIADDLHARMTASGISTRRYNLPVVDVSGDLSIRPKSKDVLADYAR